MRQIYLHKILLLALRAREKSVGSVSIITEGSLTLQNDYTKNTSLLIQQQSPARKYSRRKRRPIHSSNKNNNKAAMKYLGVKITEKKYGGSKNQSPFPKVMKDTSMERYVMFLEGKRGGCHKDVNSTSMNQQV